MNDNGLIYGLEERPPLKDTLFAALQHLLAIFVAIITPLVSGIVVTLIGMSLIKVGITSCGGGTAALENGTFGSFQNLGIAVLVLVLIVLFNRSSNRYLRRSTARPLWSLQ